MNQISDFRREAGTSRELPANLEAEHAVLGALLYDNSAYERLGDRLQARHFHEPFHQRLFGAIVELIGKGVLAEPLVLMERCLADPAFEELGGLTYLADMVDRAPPAANAGAYGQIIYDLAQRRDLIAIAEEMISGAGSDREQSARELIEIAESNLFALAETGGVSGGLEPFAAGVDGTLDVIAAAMNRGGGITGLSTGLIDLDRMLAGLHPTDLIILAARPSMGKTALATNIAYQVSKTYRPQVSPEGIRSALTGGVVAFFSLEMSKEQLIQRVLADATGISGDDMRKGRIDPNEFSRIRDAADVIRSLPLHIDDTGGLSIAKLCARARRMKRKHGLDLIVVDYLQLVTVQGGGGPQNRVQEVTQITTTLKALAKELQVPIIALSQLSRQVENREDKKPQLSDLRESGSIEQDADAVMFVYREAYYLGRAEPRTGTAEHLTWQEEMDRCAHEADLIIGKQRHGPIGTVKLHFNGDLTRFSSLARDDRYGGARLPYGGDE